MRIKSIALLLSSVSAMALMNSEPAEAYCSWHSGTKTYTCTGEMPHGERHTRHYTFDMNFSNLSHNISPRSGTHVAELGSWGTSGGNGTVGHFDFNLLSSSFGWHDSSNGHNGASLSGRSTLRYNGNGKTVTGTNATAIGLYATGGHGGHGVTGVSDWYLGSLFYSNGTHGGHGGTGAHVLASVNNVEIHTTGSWVRGVYVLSEGGYGGHGGSGGSIIKAHGGHGGNGGNGGHVEVFSSANITTSGYGSYGIEAASLAGNAGYGGAAGGAEAIGGNGGKGGKGGTVHVSNNSVSSTLGSDGKLDIVGGHIKTTGGEANAIYAISYGGIGGDGGSGGGIIGVGGDASGSGSGGEVSVVNYGTLETTGVWARGIVAKSIGGEARDGGSAGGLISIGGFGGEQGGHGGLVLVTNDGIIKTAGNHSAGIAAFSIGGGGGSGAPSGGVISIGGFGAASGDGGEIRVRTAEHSTITTTGNESDGIQVLTVGGGGGLGANSGGEFSIGGFGGGSGNGGEIIVHNAGDVSTTGYGSQAIFLQSVGGGGGTGVSESGDGNTGSAGASSGLFSVGGSGSSGGNGGAIHLTNSATSISTDGNAAEALYAASIGGGGGHGASSVGLMSFGGSSTVAGHGGAVTITTSGNVTTDGVSSNAILASSIGGGGGFGGHSIGVGLFVDTTVGGSGGAGGNGNSVTVTNNDATSAITTNGHNSTAIYATSVGGGGGGGGWSIGSSVGAFFDLSQSVGGDGGTSGSGGVVTVTNHGTISATGDSSLGIYAESIGGGGGKGNYSISNAVSAGPVAGSANLSLGGKGGASGHGGTVTVTNTNDIGTDGRNANAITAHSTGGGGGAGGVTGAYSIDLSADASGDITTNIGGSGGAGGDGGVVEVTNTDGSITTEKSGSAGISATSTGGGGGDGGWASTGAVVISGGVPVNVNISIGGSGGASGSGDDVTVTTSNTGTMTGKIDTTGAHSAGIYAKSTSRGGGNGGASYVGNLTVGSDMALGLSVSIGGEGGDGGASGAVIVNSGQKIITQGHDSDGIYAASTGGGGGDGGASYIGSIVAPNPIEVDVSVGGSGGEGGSGGAVTVNSTSDIETHGHKSVGIAAESIGGGGGNGGLSVIGNVSTNVGEEPTLSALVSIGGTGGAGNVGGVVEVNSSGSIETHGVDAYGIKATSLGGGGGNGGISAVLNIVVSLPEAEGPHANFNVSVGGDGGTGNVGGHVTVVQSGSDKLISTALSNSSGIYAQSIGGGGGTGGYSTAQTLPVKTPGLPNLSDLEGVSVTVGVGGTGGAGNHGGTVDVTNESSIETDGSFSHGIFGQSIGGGGGVAGKSGAGFVPYQTGADEEADETYETVSEGVFVGAETLTGDFVELGQVSIFVGGKGGASGDGGTVNINNSGNITLGDTDTITSQSFGILAQSIGGGGGIGGASTGGPFGNFDIGGKGGASGDGGELNVTNSASITTHGAEGYGIFAQTIGGGGGLSLAKETPGGSNAGGGEDGEGEGEGESEEPGSGGSATGTFGTEFALGIMVGGGGGGGGDGGNISLTNSGIITTHGEAAYGIIAQSIGGGGGIGKPLSILVPTQIMGSNGDDGIGGDITITHTGSITTNGERAHGIFVQSASASVEESPVITITANGDVTANGEDASAIAVQNANVEADADADSLNTYAHRGAGSIIVTVNSDVTVSGGERGEDSGADKAVGVLISGNAVSTITNHGYIETADGADGTAIWATAWNDRTVDNHGTITGSIILDSCEGSGFTTQATCWQQITDIGQISDFQRDDLAYIVNNSDGARINSGSEFHLGYGGTFNNNGLLILGGWGGIITTDFTGHYVQSSTGRLIFEVDFAKDGQAGASDLINISWDASLAGTVQWAGFNNGNVRPGDHSVTFLTTAQDGGGGVHNNGLSLINPRSAIVASSSLVFGDDSVGLNYTINFTPDGLTDNQQTLGQNISDIQAAGGLTTSSTMAAAAFTAHNVNDLGDVYSGISPEKHSKFSNLAIHSSNTMSDAIHSCRQRDGEYRFIREGECKWFRVSLQSLNNPSNTGINQLFQQKLEFAGGIQKEVGHNTHLGFGLSAVYGRQDIGDAITSTSDSLQFGVILKHRNKNTLFSLFANGGYSWHNTAREVVLDNQSLKANSSPGNGFLSMQARVAQNIDLGANWYITPSISTVATHVMNNGFTETGAAGANLIIFSSSETYISLRPTVELGAEFKGSSGDLWRPFISYGQSHIVDGQPVVTALFEGTPDGIAPFSVDGTFEKITKEMSLGVRYFNAKGTVFRVVGKRETTPTTRSIDVSLKVALPF